MEAYDIKELLKMFINKPETFICGPSYGDTNKSPKTKLRIYAYGGALCELPTKPGATIKLSHENYLKDDPCLYAIFNGLQNNEEREQFLWDYWDELIGVMEKRFTSKDKSLEERNQQTTIARAHTDFDQHSGTVVCDFEFSLPKNVGQPKFDMVTFSLDKRGHGVFTLVELKCNGNACKDSGHGLKKHAADMLKSINDSASSGWCKTELLRRLGYMCRYDLLKNCPDMLKCVSPDLRPENLELRAAFLFTRGNGLESRHDAAELCRTYIPEKDLDKLLYCFAESPEAVDLSHMKNWEAFSGNR